MRGRGSGIRERAMKGRSVVGSLAELVKGRNVSMDVKRGLRNGVLLPSLTYGLENWTWNGAQQLRVHAAEMSYLRGACGVSRWDGLSNECVYDRCGMRGHGSGAGCSFFFFYLQQQGTAQGHNEKGGKKGPLANVPARKSESREV